MKRREFLAAVGAVAVGTGAMGRLLPRQNSGAFLRTWDDGLFVGIEIADFPDGPWRKVNGVRAKSIEAVYVDGRIAQISIE